MRIVYIAGPYRGKTYNEIEENIRRAEAAAIGFWDVGFGVFCPHLNTAHFEVKSNAPAEAYVEAYLRMLEACTDIFLLPGWWDSEGARREFARAKELGMEILYKVPV